MSEERALYLGQPIGETIEDVKVLLVRGAVGAGFGEMSAVFEDERKLVPPPRGADFLLRVTGDSMTQAGILDDDLLFVRSTPNARAGEIVIAYVEGAGEVVKRLRTDTDEDGYPRAWLESESHKTQYKPMPLTGDSRIQGIVTGVYREL